MLKAEAVVDMINEDGLEDTRERRVGRKVPCLLIGFISWASN